MKINIDANKLTFSELKTLMKLVEKAEGKGTPNGVSTPEPKDVPDDKPKLKKVIVKGDVVKRVFDDGTFELDTNPYQEVTGRKSVVVVPKIRGKKSKYKKHTKRKRVQTKKIWTKQMVAELYHLVEVEGIKDIGKVARIINKKFGAGKHGKPIKENQAYQKINNVRFNKQWDSSLLTNRVSLVAKDSSRKLEKTKKIWEKIDSKVKGEFDDDFDSIVKIIEGDKLGLAKAVNKYFNGVNPIKNLHYEFKKYCNRYGLNYPDYIKSYNTIGKKIEKPSKPETKGMIRDKPFMPKSYEERCLEKGYVGTKDKQQYKLGLFPKIVFIDSTSKKQTLVNMLSRLVKDHSLFLDFGVEGYLIGIEKKADWNDFCVDFILKAKQVSAFFGVKNHFKLVEDGKKKIAYSP